MRRALAIGIIASLLSLAAVTATPLPAPKPDSPASSDSSTTIRPWVTAARLVSLRGVAKDLKLTKQQEETIEKLHNEGTAKRSETMDKHRGASEAEVDKLLDAINENEEKSIAKVMTPQQVKRLNQLAVRELGPDAPYVPELMAALKLTNEQQDRLKALRSQGWKELQSTGFNPGHMLPPPKMKSFGPIWKAQTEKVAAVFTDDQKKIWNELRGPEFEFDFVMVPYTPFGASKSSPGSSKP